MGLRRYPRHAVGGGYSRPPMANGSAAWQEGIELKRVPAHVACVMDGNGRWAQRRGLKRTEGHAAGEEALWDVVQGAIDLGIEDKERANAHKHLAFIHCSSNRQQQCREEFRKALAIDPALELAPAEAGHPVWGPIFRSLKAAR